MAFLFKTTKLDFFFVYFPVKISFISSSEPLLRRILFIRKFCDPILNIVVSSTWMGKIYNSLMTLDLIF